jgi:hypothetical protein
VTETKRGWWRMPQRPERRGRVWLARKSPLDVYANVGKQIKEGRHVGLDFYDLLIEAIGAAVEATKPPEPPV